MKTDALTASFAISAALSLLLSAALAAQPVQLLVEAPKLLVEQRDQG
jgi:hypothetical protein